ncbi:two-component regulator propeller domain-containing protein [Draconibacterium sp.]|uniref:hybrid sensor histidine kinase/response regulator transcription factor n=1 Tax=Draconibacterium sp. TaxID=1965318 RepID=UPI003561A919
MKPKCFLVLLLFIYSFKLHASIDEITFRRISPPGGYSFQAIHNITQDMMGYIWMGSSDGIIRYDSKEVIRFVHQANNPNSIPSNRISGIEIDNKNNVWVSTDAGLCLYNHKNQNFDAVDYTYEDGTAAGKQINSITLDGEGKLWISDQDFFGYLNAEHNQLIRISKGLNKLPRLLYTDDTNRLWLGTQDGTIFRISANQKKAEKIIDGPGSVTRTIFATNDQILVGFDTHGARRYDMHGNLISQYSYPINPQYNFERASIRKIWRDTRGRIWIGSYFGLFLDTGTNLIRFDQEEYSGLPHNSIYDIYEDKQGGLWISTWSGGIAYLHHADNKFKTFRHSLAPNTLSSNMVSSFAQTTNGELYVGTELNGLNLFDKRSNSFQKIKVLKNGGILNIKSLCADDKGGLWVGSAFNGLFYREKGETVFKNFSLGTENRSTIPRIQVYALCKSDSGIWIGSSAGGLLFYSFEKKEIVNQSNTYPLVQLNNVTFRHIALDSKNNLWLASLNGMFQVHLPSGKIKRFSTDNLADFNPITPAFYFVTELSDGRIWMGTRANGIYIYDPETNQLSHFTAKGVLKGHDVYGIIEGYDNSICITTNDGLFLYETEKDKVRKFEITDGIQGNLFNPGAIFNDSNNNLYVGGTNGFTVMGPSSIKMNELAPNVLISKVEVNNQKVIPSQNIRHKFNKLVLDPQETSIKFHFSADNYLLPEKNRFMYRLTNYIDEWVGENIDGTATFFNVPAGNYIFEVTACNNDGIWNDIPTQLPVEIKQFWHKSQLALIFYSIAVFLILLAFYNFMRERVKLKKTILIEKIKYEQEEQLHEMKLTFFTNISHEFRTPLTLINWPLKKLIEADNLSDEQREQLKTIKRNTNRLLQLINQIMDLRKVEKGKTKLNITKIELVNFVQERILNFSEEAKQKNIQFAFNHNNENTLIEADDEKLDKIIYNLLSNAFKFTPVNGKITVEIHDNQIQRSNYFSNQLSYGKLENEDFVDIQVIDSGIGIESDDLPKVFERFEQGKKNKTNEYSSGIGLNLCKEYTLMHRGAIIVQSTPGEGTSFSVQLPAKQKAQKIMYQNQTLAKNISSWQPQEKAIVKEKVVNEDINLLVIEDNVDLRKFLISFLKDYYTILWAENGKQALDILKTQNIHLVISDVMMPVMDGFEFCNILKSQIETSHIPIILLTALSSEENTITGLSNGADAYIAKPFDENLLLSQIDNLLEQRKRLRKNFVPKFISNQPVEMGSLDNYFLNKVNLIIEQNIEDENFSVEKLATELGFSRSQLHRKLKQISNYSSSEYIMIVRMKKAATLLASKQFTIEEVAYKTGFNSHSYFSKCFKKLLNKTPKEYIKDL